MDFEKRKTLRVLGTAPVLTSGIAYSSSQAYGATRSKLNKAPESKQQEVKATLVQFKDEMPNEERERLRRIKEVSTSSCGTVESILPNVDLDSISTETLIGDSAIGVLKNIIGNINKAYDVDVSTKYLGSVARLTKFVPLLSSVQNFLSVCCDIREKVIESADFVTEIQRETTTHPLIEEFYISLLLLLTELALLPVAVGYRPAFMGTRYVANYGLVRVRHVVGLRIYSVLLSIVHWALRGTIGGAISYTVDKSSKLAKEFDDKEAFEVEEVKKSDLASYDFLEEQQSRWGGLFGSNEDPWDTLRNEFSDTESLINSKANGDDDDRGGWFSGW